MILTDKELADKALEALDIAGSALSELRNRGIGIAVKYWNDDTKPYFDCAITKYILTATPSQDGDRE
jgi:hypothetical protein